VRTTLTFLALILMTAGCASKEADDSALPRGAESVKIDPADFTTRIDNPYLPLAPGSKWIYREGEQRVVVTVSTKTKTIAGIEARVVHDVATEHGKVIEDTYDWYAQDRSGNVWYLGEDTKEFENGKVVSTEGSWEAGVDDAQPGVVMPADPNVGLVYRQEYYKGHAEDAAEILGLEEKVEVPFGSFGDVVLTKDYTPLDPRMVEHKFYARGVGQVLAIGISGTSDREELVRFLRP
jgi:hypothetical protein